MGWFLRDVNRDIDRMMEGFERAGCVEERLVSQRLGDDEDDEPERPRPRRIRGGQPPPDIW